MQHISFTFTLNKKSIPSLGDIFRYEHKFKGHSFGSMPKTDPVAIAQNLPEQSVQNHFQSFSHHEKPTYSRKIRKI